MMNGMITQGQETKVWLKRQKGPGEFVRIVTEISENIRCYHLYAAYDDQPYHLGRILFDGQGFWIYDGTILSINEQEQLAKFIIKWNN